MDRCLRSDDINTVASSGTFIPIVTIVAPMTKVGNPAKIGDTNQAVDEQLATNCSTDATGGKDEKIDHTGSLRQTSERWLLA